MDFLQSSQLDEKPLSRLVRKTKARQYYQLQGKVADNIKLFDLGDSRPEVDYSEATKIHKGVLQLLSFRSSNTQINMEKTPKSAIFLIYFVIL